MGHFLHVLTPKGLNYLLRNDSSLELRQAIKNELQRRARKEEKTELVKERDIDGYERDQ